MIDKILDSVKDNFIKYLTSLGLSPKSYKNYRSDLNHFVSWTLLRVRSFGSFVESLTEAVPFLGSDLAREYVSFMKVNGFPGKTINRRLSTLRHLSRFLVISQIIDSDFMVEIENISFTGGVKSQLNPMLREFCAHLKAQKISPNTVKNYESDVRQFLTWLETNHQPPVTNH